MMHTVGYKCNRYGTSAIWLFGIERSLRLLFMMLGRGATALATGHELFGIAGEQISEKHGLTAREAEILRLLAQHKTVGMIERECHIANGTAKAHIRHIYQKLDIHSCGELFEMLDVPSA